MATHGLDMDCFAFVSFLLMARCEECDSQHTVVANANDPTAYSIGSTISWSSIHLVNPRVTSPSGPWSTQ